MPVEMDHLVVAAETLEQGVDWVERRLGLTCRPGGQHPKMGTHNALVRLGEALYLEVIAVDPGAEAPAAPRWFGLDDAVVRRELHKTPRLLTWVARSSDIETTLAACGFELGPPRPMQRGRLRWRIAFGDDGRLEADGLVPALIEWDQATSHPADSLPDQGAALVELEGWHPRPVDVSRKLDGLGLAEALTLRGGREPGLQAVIRTPSGERLLGR